MEIGGRDNETTSEGDREGIRNTITRTNGSGEHYLQMKVRNPHSDLERKLGMNENFPRDRVVEDTFEMYLRYRLRYMKGYIFCIS